MNMRKIGSALLLVLFLAIGAANFYFSNGIAANLFAAWLAPIFLLRFSRSTRPWIGVPIIGLVAGSATWFAFQGVIPGGDNEIIVVAIAAGIMTALIYLADRLISPRLSGIAATMVLPAATVTALLIGSLGAPFGTWANDAYVQYDFLWLSRFASITGIWGIAFLPAWLAAVVNQWVEGGFGPPLRRKSAIAFFAGFAAVMGHGAIGSLDWSNSHETVMAGLVGGRMDRPDYQQCLADDIACRERALDEQYNDPLFERSALLAMEGAKIIAWHEAAAVYQKGFESRLLDRAAEFAAEHKVYLVAGLLALPDGAADGLMQNKVIIFSPDGRRSEEYLKARPVPGEPIVQGDGRPLLFDTSYGRIAVIICFDADFTAPARQAANAGADLLVVPSADWEEITPMHAEMTAFRAIETGLPVLRPAANGLSAMISPSGNITASLNSFSTNQDVLLAPFDLSAERTLQRHIGDLFAWLSVALLILLVILAFRRPRRVESGSIHGYSLIVIVIFAMLLTADINCFSSSKFFPRSSDVQQNNEF
jgi:apolipoprotein N-acyltransferase